MTNDKLQKYIEHFEQKDRMGSLFKMKITEVNAQECLCEYTVQEAHFNPNGILHGGALYTVMDSSQGAFIHLNLDPQFKYAATGTATIKYLAPVREGKVLIRTWFKEIQGRKHFVSSEAKNEKGDVLATLEEIWIATFKDKA